MDLEQDQIPLSYAGMMGHTICIVGGSTDERRICAECDDITWAKAYVAKHAPEELVIYRRTKTGWKRTA